MSKIEEQLGESMVRAYVTLQHMANIGNPTQITIMANDDGHFSTPEELVDVFKRLVNAMPSVQQPEDFLLLHAPIIHHSEEGSHDSGEAEPSDGGGAGHDPDLHPEPKDI